MKIILSCSVKILNWTLSQVQNRFTYRWLRLTCCASVSGGGTGGGGGARGSFFPKSQLITLATFRKEFDRIATRKDKFARQLSQQDVTNGRPMGLNALKNRDDS